MKKFFILALFFLILPVNASAQIVNVQGLLAEKPQKGLKINLGGNGLIKTGNVDYKKFSAISAIRYFNEPNTIIFTSSAEYAEKDEVPFWERYFEHLRYRYALGKYFGTDTFIQHEYNKFKRFSLRMLYGVGGFVNYRFNFDVKLTFGLDYMFEYNRYSEDSAYTDSGEIKKYHRLDSYFNVAYSHSNFTVTDTVYYQPEISNFSNLMFYNEISLIFKLTTRFSVSSSFAYSYNANPPQGVKKTDTKTTFGLNIALGPY